MFEFGFTAVAGAERDYLFDMETNVGEQWHYIQAGIQGGPVSALELKQLASNGELSPNDMVWKQNMPDWAPAGKVKGLFEIPAPNTPPPIPSIPRHSTIQPSAVPLIMGLHRQRFAIAVAAGVGMVATFLPWVHIPIIGSVSGTAGDGWITLCLFAPALTLALRGLKSEPVVGSARLGAVIPAGIAALLGLQKLVAFKGKMGEIPRDNPFAQVMSASVRIGIGLYILIAAGIAVAVLAWMLEKSSPARP